MILIERKLYLYIGDRKMGNIINGIKTAKTPVTGSAHSVKDGSEISWEEALDLLLGAAATTDPEMCPLEECTDRVLAEDLLSPLDQPPFRRSAMDGYALRRADVAGAEPGAPAVLKVKGCIYAGDPPLDAGILGAGEAVRIMTGAAVPDEADVVIRREDTDEGEDSVRIFSNGSGRNNISPVGEDFGRGECLISKGTHLDAYALSCACAAGVSSLPVRRKIRAGLIMTGNELTPPGQPLKPGKIYNSSQSFLNAKLTGLGGRVVSAVYVEDDRERITETILSMKKDVDIIITTGGVSAGDLDLVPQAVEEAGAEILFHGIFIKPGMPTLGAVCDGVPILGLSGNPYSAAAIFEILGRPLIWRMLGCAGKAFAAAEAVLASDVAQNGDVPRVMMGYFDGKKVLVYGKQHNAQMKYGIGSNCILILSPGRRVYRAGEKLEILL